jgi:hypothetical protein
VARHDSEKTENMWDSILSLGFSLLLGFIGLAVAGWQVATLGAAASLDNLFLTLVALLMAVAGFGYVLLVLSGNQGKGKAG